VEAFVPDIAGFTDGQAVRAVHITIDSTTLEASVHDPSRRLCSTSTWCSPRAVCGCTRFPCATHGPASSTSWRGWLALNCASGGEGGTARPSRHRVPSTSPCMGGRRRQRQRRRGRAASWLGVTGGSSRAGTPQAGCQTP
jgi:hypothetical protein